MSRTTKGMNSTRYHSLTAYWNGIVGQDHRSRIQKLRETQMNAKTHIGVARCTYGSSRIPTFPLTALLSRHPLGTSRRTCDTRAFFVFRNRGSANALHFGCQVRRGRALRRPNNLARLLLSGQALWKHARRTATRVSSMSADDRVCYHA